MVLRFSSGSVTPARASKNRSAAFTWTRSTWNWRRNVSSTCSASPARMSPVSTKTQVSWSPTALWTRAAATAESTPPDSAQSTRSPPTWARTASTADSMIEMWVQRGAAPAHVEEEALEELRAPVGVDHLGVELHAVDAPVGVAEGGHRRARRSWPVTTKPGGASVMASPWLIHTSAPRPASRRTAARTPASVSVGPAVLALAGAGDRAAELLGDQLGAVADAEDRDPEVVDGRVDRAGAGVS